MGTYDEAGGWKVWHRRARSAGPWSLVAEAATEREALLASFVVRVTGDLLILRAGQDPNDPAAAPKGTRQR